MIIKVCTCMTDITVKFYYFIENALSNKVNDIVLRLMKKYLNEKHHIFVENFYNRFSISALLLKKRLIRPAP